MSPELIAVILWVSLFVLLLSGFPIAFSMLVVSVVGILAFVNLPGVSAIYLSLFASLSKDIFIAIPLFTFMATILEVSGIGESMYDVMYKWMAGLKGGLAIGTVAICTVIAAMTGLGGTGILIMGILGYPEMRKRGYSKDVAIGSITAGAILGPIIPPSMPAIIIAGMTGVSVGALFMAGVIPGLIISALFMLYITISCIIKPTIAPAIPVTERASWKAKFTALVKLIGPLLLVGLVLGTIYLGVCTPTEAGAIGAVGALVITVANRRLTRKRLSEAATTTFKITVMVMWLVVGGVSFTSLCGITGVKTVLEHVMLALPLSSAGVLTMIMIILLILGMFLEIGSLIMITIPIMFPVAVQLGFDPIWFCFIYILNCIIGGLTPPVGYNLFYFKGLGHKDVTMGDVYHSVIPYIFIMVIVLVLVIAVPQVAVLLPNMMKK